MNMGDLLIGLGGPTVAAAAVILNGWWAKRGGRHAAEIESSNVVNVNWAKHAEELREWTDDKMAAMHWEMDRYEARVTVLETRQDEMQKAFRELSRKYQAALRAIRHLMAHVDSEMIDHLPQEILDDL